MGVEGGQPLQEQYTAKWLELKLALTAKYFSEKDLAGSCACKHDPDCCMPCCCALTKGPQSASSSPFPQAASTTR